MDSRHQAGNGYLKCFLVGSNLNPIGVFCYIGAVLNIPSQIWFEVWVGNILNKRWLVGTCSTWSEQLFQVHGGIRLYSGQSMKQYSDGGVGVGGGSQCYLVDYILLRLCCWTCKQFFVAFLIETQYILSKSLQIPEKWMDHSWFKTWNWATKLDFKANDVQAR